MRGNPRRRRTDSTQEKKETKRGFQLGFLSLSNDGQSCDPMTGFLGEASHVDFLCSFSFFLFTHVTVSSECIPRYLGSMKSK